LSRLAVGADPGPAADKLRRRPGIPQRACRLHRSQHRISGIVFADVLPLLGLPWELFTINRLEFYGKVNFLKGALVYADHVTTVSKRYSWRSRPPSTDLAWKASCVCAPYGLRNIEWRRLSGMESGNDKFIAAKYSDSGDLTGKLECKKDLLAQFGLQDAELSLPVVGIVSRFVAQKGFDLIAKSLIDSRASR